MRDLNAAYRTLDRAACREPWLVQGSVNVVAPTSPSGSVTYTWTRKVRGKTVTVALSRQQFVTFRRAIEVNRRIEAALSQLREVSQTALLSEVPGVSKRRLGVPKSAEAKRVPKGA
ncbi:MAG: DUF6788 family protein [Planctomycetota bacterium]